jgi:alkylation response protein AidB-like acyl-CoA dehydrogenase
MRWHKILYQKGWIAPSWPKEHGGTGWTAVQKYIFDEESGLGGAPRISSFGISMCGPVLMAFGTEAQKKEHLPKILSGERVWCQGYSEPGSGSDLASLKTKAERVGDHWVINGSKIWTSLAHHADWIFLLARTSTGKKKQDGISFFIFPTTTPGFEIRPIITLNMLNHTNQTFFTDVKIPADAIVGEEGKGWTIAKYLLGHERMGGGSCGELKTALQISSARSSMPSCNSKASSASSWACWVRSRRTRRSARPLP